MTTTTEYFVGGELEAFVNGSHAATTWVTSGGTYDSDFARGGVSLTVASETPFIRAPLTSAQAVCWVSFQCYRSSSGGGGGQGPASGVWFDFMNASLVSNYRVVGVGGTNSQPSLQFQYRSGAGWVNIGNPMVVPTDARHKWDFFFSQSGTPDIRAYVDGVPLGQVTGITAPTPANLLEIRHYTLGQGIGSIANQIVLSEYQVLDVTTLGRRLATLYVSADGATNDWTPSTGTSTAATIDEVGIYSDSDYDSSATANQVYTCVTSDLSVTAQQYGVDGLILAYRTQRGATGPQNLAGVVRVGGTNYVSAATVTGPFGGLISDFAYSWAKFQNNPATSAAFTPAEINTAGFETGAKSLA